MKAKSILNDKFETHKKNDSFDRYHKNVDKTHWYQFYTCMGNMAAVMKRCKLNFSNATKQLNQKCYCFCQQNSVHIFDFMQSF